MGGTAATKTKDAASAEPTAAQLATIATLCDALGVEPPEPVSVEAAQAVIETLQAAYDERDGDPALVAGTDEGADDKPADLEDEPAAPPADPGLSMEETHKLFDLAVDAFGTALRTVFAVEELQPAQTPGVVGFVLPGFTEELPHDNFARCTTCNGHGDVLTGSTKVGNERRPCPDPRCKGLGYWTKAEAPQPVQPTLIAVPQPTPNGDGVYVEAPTWLGDPTIISPAV